MAEVVFRHGIEYPDNHGIPLSDIAATLIAQERLLPVVSGMLQELYPGLSIEKAAISLDNLRHGSLSEAFFVAIFIVFQKELESEVPELIEHITGVHVSDRYDTVVTVLFMIALYYSAKTIFERGKKKVSPSQKANILEDDYKTYVNIGSLTMNVSEKEIESALERVVPKKSEPLLARAALDIIRPAKRGGNGRIIPRGLPEVSAASVAKFPTELAFTELADDTFPIHMQDALLEIRATDRDKTKNGWAGRISADGVTTKRLPVVLAPGVDPEALHHRDEVRVEAMLESKITEDGGTKPVRIHVFRTLDA
jgi:hypothetical protein